MSNGIGKELAMSEDSILQYALSQGILNVDVLRREVEEMQREKYLSKHNYQIWQGKNGKWYTELPATADSKRRLVKKTYKEDLEEEIINFYKSSDMYVTFRKAFEEWVNAKLLWNEISKGTYDRYTGEFKRFFENTDLPGMRVDLITDDYMDTYIRNRVADLELSSKAYGNMKTLLVGPLKYAKKRSYTKFSIGTFLGDFAISSKAFKKKEKKKQVFKRGEVDILSKWLWSHPKLENWGILLAFETGLRSAELVALKFSDVDGDFISISRQQIRYKAENEGEMKKEIVDYTKTEAGSRHVVLTEKAKEIIEHIKEFSDSKEYMFSKNGSVIDKTRFNEYLSRACNNCDITVMSMHKIRKTYGTRLLDGGADDSTIQEQMGHTDVATTRKCYYDSDKEKDEIIKQVRTAIA